MRRLNPVGAVRHETPVVVVLFPAPVAFVVGRVEKLYVGRVVQRHLDVEIDGAVIRSGGGLGRRELGAVAYLGDPADERSIGVRVDGDLDRIVRLRR